jgi:hypothetical protein
MTGKSAMHENAASAPRNDLIRTRDDLNDRMKGGPATDAVFACRPRLICPDGIASLSRRKGNHSGRSVPSSPGGTKRAVGMMVSGGSVSFGVRENIIRCSLALEMKKG